MSRGLGLKDLREVQGFRVTALSQGFRRVSDRGA